MKKTMTHIFAKLSFAASTIVLASGANALSFAWDFQNTTFTNSFTESSIAGAGLTTGGTIGVRAYSATTNSSTWVNTPLFTNQGTAGIGIQNFQQGGAEPTTLPEGAIDTRGGVTDIVVLDAGAGKTVDWTTIMIGYGQDYNTGNNGGIFQSGTRADLQLFSGNSANFNTVCFNGCGANSLTGGGGLGFSSTSLNNVPINTTTTFSLLTPSRYLVIAGDINDAFALKQIGGTSNLVPTGVPEPATMLLLGLGLLGLGIVRRRSKV